MKNKTISDIPLFLRSRSLNEMRAETQRQQQKFLQLSLMLLVIVEIAVIFFFREVAV